MESTEKSLTSEESLKIITEMVNKTKVNISQGSFHLLFWGWLIFVCSIAEFLLAKLTGFAHPYYAWFLVIPGVFVSMTYGFIKGRNARFHTYADMVYMWTWIGFLCAAIVLFVVQSKRMDLISPYILLLAGLPTFVSGFIIRFRPLVIGGICFWVISIAMSLTGPGISSLGVPVAMLAGYLIPGYMLKNRVANDTL
jgi:hypothetical protein